MARMLQPADRRSRRVRRPRGEAGGGEHDSLTRDASGLDARRRGGGRFRPCSLEVGIWVGQLVRALRTSRLYDEANPTVVRVREELAASLISRCTRFAGAIHAAGGRARALDVGP